LIDLEHYQGGKLEDGLALPYNVWPRYLLYLCDWGLATTTCIDARSGNLYHVYPDEQEGYYRIQLAARSLADWLTMWLADRLVDKSSEIEKRLREIPRDISLRQVFEG
jgi:hypothetical protein